MPALPEAVLWDLDGTLVDTEPAWMAAERALVAEHGGTWSEADALNLVGNNLLDSAHYLRQHGSVTLEPEAIIDRLVGAVLEHLGEHIEWRPGARELLAGLRAAGIPCALVTMSYRVLADTVVAALPEDTFATTVTGDEVQNGKPHPEPYLKAAATLGVDPSRCLVIEDSVTGARSGHDAGATVLAVPNVVSVPAGEGIEVRPSLAGITLDDLGELMTSSARA